MSINSDHCFVILYRMKKGGLFVLWLLLLFISLALDKCIWSCEHVIEEKTGEVICNQLYAPCNACGSFQGPNKCNMLRGAVAYFETL